METGQTALGVRKRSIGTCILFAMAAAFFYFAVYRVYTGAAVLDTQSAFAVMALFIVLGEVISTKTMAFLPAMFISATLFVLGFWTFVPKDVLARAGIAPNMPGFLVMMMVVHLGTMLNLQQLKEQWRTVVITLAGMLGILVLVLSVGTAFLGFRLSAIAAPPLTGGFVAALMMQEAAKGDAYLVVLAMAVYVLQGFVGYPLTSLCLKKESRSILKKIRAGEEAPELEIDKRERKGVENSDTGRFFPDIPERYKSATTTLLQMALLVVVSGYLETLSRGYVSKFVWALLVGVAAGQMKFIDPEPLVRSRSMGYVYTTIMMFVFAGLSGVTPEILKKLIADFAFLIVIATVGIALFSIPVGRKLGLSTPMSFALGLGSIAGGFPASYVLSVEAARVMAETEEEYKLLENHLLPKTLVAGFVSATSGSVLIAGAVISMFF